MTKRIFRAVCLTSLAVFLATMLMISDAMYNYFTDLQRKQLAAETSIAAAAMEHSGTDFLNDIDTEQYRITRIAADGTVLFDSASDSDTMENHLEREEIRAAMNDGFGESSRFSTTLMERRLYCARKLKDGTLLRLSVSHGSILLLIIGMLQPILIIVTIAALISFIMAKVLSKRIVEPMNRLDSDSPDGNCPYPELDPLLHRLHRQQLEIRGRTASLRRKQDELNTIIGNMKEGMILLDADGRILSINRSATKMPELALSREGDLLFDRCSNPELKRAFEKTLLGEAAELRMELPSSVMLISSAPVMTEDRVIGAAIVLFDITQKEQAEQQRRDFTANVSHELKTPLHAILGYSELLKCGIAKPEDVRSFAATIYSEAQRLIALVEDIINLSHLDAGGAGLRRTAVDLYSVAEDVLSSLSELASKNEVTLSITGSSSVITGFPEALREIIGNLCDNAVKYNRRGGRVELIVRDHSVTVRDTGIGIPKEDRDRIFERFYRVDKSRSKEVGGTGLGLSIVKHAVLIHNAHIELQSEVGKGTTVTVTFPEEQSDNS